MYGPSARCSRMPCPRTFSGELWPCCQTSGNRSPSWASKAPWRMVRPSVHFKPYFDAQPLKSGCRSMAPSPLEACVTVAVPAECIKLVSGEESPKSSREISPILNCPFILGSSALSERSKLLLGDRDLPSHLGGQRTKL